MPETTDQEALTAAVERFGVDKWWGGWQAHDLYYYWADSEDVRSVVPPQKTINMPYMDDCHVYAGTWAVGRLIEAMGKAFRGVNITMSHKWCVYLGLPRTTTYGVVVLSTSRIGLCDTPLQALIKARTAMLEEGSHD